MIHGARCHIKEMARRFLLMSPAEMEYVFMRTSHLPNVKEAYEVAKLMREQQSKSALQKKIEGEKNV